MADDNKVASGSSHTRTRLGRGAAAAVAAAVMLATAGAAGAQTAAEEEIEATWDKICNTDPKTNKELCIIKQDLRTESGQFVASIAIYEAKNEKRKKLQVLIPPGMLIQPGVRLQIDKSKPKTMKYSICYTNACLVELPIDAKFITQMKKGNMLVVTGLNQQAKPVPFKLTLAGFTATYDGAGINATELAEREKKLQEKLRERAKAARQRLIDEQNKAREAAADQ